MSPSFNARYSLAACRFAQHTRTAAPPLFNEDSTYHKGGETVAVSAMHMPNPTQPIYAVQHIRRMRGGSQSHLLRASDNNFYVTKFRNNPQHDRVLANEYLATKLGIFLGLPMPEAAIIEVPEWIAENSPDLKIDLAGVPVRCPSGLQFGSRYVADPLETTVFDYLPETILLKIGNLQDFARVLAFDKWTGNSDGRQAVFFRNAKEHRYCAVFIDQGYCFNAGEWDFPDSPLKGTFVRNSVYESVTGWASFEPVLSRIEVINSEDIWAIARQIPPDWYQDDREALSQLVGSLHLRTASVRDLITSFRNSTRNPFPNWVAEQSRPTQAQPKSRRK